MLGEAIAARALGDAGRRVLATEQAGPRPEGVAREAAGAAPGKAPALRPTKP